MIEKFGTELPSKSLDLQNSFNEIKETPETEKNSLDHLDNLDKTSVERIEHPNGDVSEVVYENDVKVSETKTSPDGTERNIDYQPEIGSKVVEIQKPNGQYEEVTHFSNGDISRETYSKEGQKLSSFERVGNHSIEKQYNTVGNLHRTVEKQYDAAGNVDHRIEKQYDTAENAYRGRRDGEWFRIPNQEYTLDNGAHYKTDELGRLVYAKMDTISVKDTNSRENIDSKLKIPGVEKTDDRGHLIADRMGGTPGIENLVAQDSNLNRGEFKALENKACELSASGHEVGWQVEPRYFGDSQRPENFVVTMIVDGETQQKTFEN